MKQVIKSAARGFLAAAVGAGVLTVGVPLAAHGSGAKQHQCVSLNGNPVVSKGFTSCTSATGTVAVGVGCGASAASGPFNAVAVSPPKVTSCNGGSNASGVTGPAVSFNCFKANTGGVCINDQQITTK